MTGGDLPWFSDYGFQLSRGFRALKAWMSIKEHGIKKYGRLIQQNIDQATYLADLIVKAPELELVAPVPLNVVCYRYRKSGLDDAALDGLNRQIIVELQEQGVAAPSGTNIKGRYVIHVAVTNHRSSREDFDVLLKETIRIGNKRAASLS
jgi:glutamate/tyrosine decarboxylase-like PLP-dependent enzyme